MNINHMTAIIMASGLSKRMGSNKLALSIDSKPLISYVLDFVSSLDFSRRILVISKPNLKITSVPENIRIILNDFPYEGQSKSVRLGTEAAVGEGFIFFPADQPFLDKASLNLLLSEAKSDNIVMPTVNEKAGSPVFFGSSFKNELLALTGDAGGRQIIKNHKDVLLKVEVPNKNFTRDIDTPEDFIDFQKNLNQFQSF